MYGGWRRAGAWFAANAAMNFGADLRMDLFEKMQKFSFNNIDKFSTGSLITEAYQ